MAGSDNLQLAVVHYNKAAKLIKENTVSTDTVVKHKVFFNLGIVYRRQGKPEESIRALVEVAQNATPTTKPATYNNLGLSYFDNQEWDSARTQFENAINAQKALNQDENKGNVEDLAFYHNNQGLCYYHLARASPEDDIIMNEAVKEYKKAIELNPNNAIHYFNKGNVYLN
jgi:tetratricopeptide (TPR) repeat protein